MTKQKAYSEKRFFEWHKDDLSVSLRNKGGSYGGGSEVLIVSYVPMLSEVCVPEIGKGSGRSTSRTES